MSRSTRSPAEIALLALTLIAQWWRLAQQTARLAIGLPDYDVYAAHMRRVHPDVAPMDRDAFFRERMEARYGKGRSRCC